MDDRVKDLLDAALTLRTETAQAAKAAKKIARQKPVPSSTIVRRRKRPALPTT